MPRFRVNFSGLLAFVPHTKREQMMVLALDAKPRHQSLDGEELFPHFTVIHYQLADLDPSSPRRPDLTGRGYGVNFIDLEEITIGKQPHEAPKLDYRLAKDNPKPDEPSTTTSGVLPEDLRWIMPIHKVGAAPKVPINNLKIQSGLLASPYKVPPANLISARLKLSQGRLYCRDFQRKEISGEKLNVNCNFQFAPTSSHWSQTIATTVAYEPTAETIQDPVVIQSDKFQLADGSPGKPGDLRFRAPGSIGRDVVVHFWVAPLPAILDVLVGGDKHTAPFPSGDRTFRSYFRLCKGPIDELPTFERNAMKATKNQAMLAQPLKDFSCPMGRCLPHDFD